MTDRQWEILVNLVEGGHSGPPPVGFIIDSPWLPNWAGMSLLDYYSSEERWFDAHLLASETFPQAIFLPGFWSEFGMCTEPSAFGARCIFPENEFPFAEKIYADENALDDVPEPDPRNDGLLPFMIKRLEHKQDAMRRAGHEIRFAVSRGPLNILSFLMGVTEFLTLLKLEPEKADRALRSVTRFVTNWIGHQRERFPSIDGVLVLDDIVGFLGEEDFLEFAKPHLETVFRAAGTRVRLFHNDSPCRVSVPYLAGIGVNLYNMGVDLSLSEIDTLTGGSLPLLGNIPPRDVLAGGTEQDVRSAVRTLLRDHGHSNHLIASCAGGMPPGVPTANIAAFIEEVGKRG